MNVTRSIPSSMQTVMWSSVVGPRNPVATMRGQAVYRDGYKAYIAVEPETGRITAASLTAVGALRGTRTRGGGLGR